MDCFIDSISKLTADPDDLTSDPISDTLPESVQDFHVLIQFMSQFYIYDIDHMQRQHFVLSGYSHELLRACGKLLEAGTALVTKLEGSNPDRFKTSVEGLVNQSGIMIAVGAHILHDDPASRSVQLMDKVMRAFMTYAGRMARDPQLTTFLNFIAAMYRLAIRERCGAPGCEKTPTQHKLRYCSSCLRVSYCSVDCQREAWRLSACAHRDVCSKIRSLCTTHGLERDSNMILQVLKRHISLEVSPDDSVNLLDLEFVINHFNKMTALEMQTSRKSCLHRPASDNLC